MCLFSICHIDDLARGIRIADRDDIDLIGCRRRSGPQSDGIKTRRACSVPHCHGIRRRDIIGTADGRRLAGAVLDRDSNAHGHFLSGNGRSTGSQK